MEPNVDAAATGALVRRATSRMEMLIRDLLALSQVERLSRDAVCDPASVMATIYDELAERAQAKTGTLRATVDPARVLCNEGLLLQVLSNLSDNALKYARPEVPPTIDINGRTDGRWYELRIADNGVGMSEDEAREAFTPFYRAMRLRGAPGTGLGLSIVKRVAEASGGSVVVESKLGVGTTFVLRLRIADGSTVET
jgi:two-component system phosphate regulon sensor histidine kinase PhoR